jgi:hypothetical protein
LSALRPSPESHRRIAALRVGRYDAVCPLERAIRIFAQFGSERSRHVRFADEGHAEAEQMRCWLVEVIDRDDAVHTTLSEREKDVVLLQPIEQAKD